MPFVPLRLAHALPSFQFRPAYALPVFQAGLAPPHQNWFLRCGPLLFLGKPCPCDHRYLFARWGGSGAWWVKGLRAVVVIRGWHLAEVGVVPISVVIVIVIAWDKRGFLSCLVHGIISAFCHWCCIYIVLIFWWHKLIIIIIVIKSTIVVPG